MCPRCNSNLVRFIFDDKYNAIWRIAELIHVKKVKLSEDIKYYYADKDTPKWLCYECYNCGVVLY